MALETQTQARARASHKGFRRHHREKETSKIKKNIYSKVQFGIYGSYLYTTLTGLLRSRSP
jgi:hypothetical protein